MKRILFTTLTAFAVGIGSSTAAPVSFYIGIDNLATLSSGTYAGRDNPNFGRLTLLLNHGDHFHGIGAYSYSGPSSTPTVIPTSTNNRIPEISSGELPLPLTAGTGLYSQKLVNKPGASEYSAIEFASMNHLSGFASGSEEDVLFNSSGGRWSRSLSGAELALELINITPGLHIGTTNVTDVLAAPGSVFPIGDGAGFSFTPVFWTDANAPLGTYSVTMRLHDLSTSSAILSSGEFSFDFAAVPEPGATILVGSGLLIAIILRRISRRSHGCTHWRGGYFDSCAATNDDERPV